MIQKSIAHDNIVHLFNAFEDRHRVYMIMELCDMSVSSCGACNRVCSLISSRLSCIVEGMAIR